MNIVHRDSIGVASAIVVKLALGGAGDGQGLRLAIFVIFWGLLIKIFACVGR